MRKVPLTINISEEDLIELAKKDLGMVPAGAQSAPPTRAPVLSVAFHERSEAVRMAIDHVLRAVARFDRDQYSAGEASAATALFEAGKRLRKAVAEEKTAKSEKGKFHV